MAETPVKNGDAKERPVIVDWQIDRGAAQTQGFDLKNRALLRLQAKDESNPKVLEKILSGGDDEARKILILENPNITEQMIALAADPTYKGLGITEKFNKRTVVDLLIQRFGKTPSIHNWGLLNTAINSATSGLYGFEQR